MVIKTILLISLITTPFLIGCCSRSNPSNSREPFTVTVFDETGKPLEGATIAGGIDWDVYRIQTNSNGEGTLSGSALGQEATVYKTNYLPMKIAEISSSRYTMNQTEKRLDSIGNVVGKSIKFAQNELITLEPYGKYHVYTYDDQSISEIYNQQICDTLIRIWDMQMFGDTLWFTTHSSGVFAFSLENPTSPRMLIRLAISDCLKPFALKDSIIVLGMCYGQLNAYPLKILSFLSDGGFQQISTIQKYYVDTMHFYNDALVLFGVSDCLPTIFDLSDPANPKLLYNGLEPGYRSGFLFGNFAIIEKSTASGGYAGSPIRIGHRVLDISNPASPSESSKFNSDSWLTGIVCDTIVYGNYYYHEQTISILEGSLVSSFRTIATASERANAGIAGAFLPYFLIDNKLWKLNDRL